MGNVLTDVLANIEGEIGKNCKHPTAFTQVSKHRLGVEYTVMVIHMLAYHLDFPHDLDHVLANVLAFLKGERGTTLQTFQYIYSVSQTQTVCGIHDYGDPRVSIPSRLPTWMALIVFWPASSTGKHCMHPSVFAPFNRHELGVEYTNMVTPRSPYHLDLPHGADNVSTDILTIIKGERGKHFTHPNIFTPFSQTQTGCGEHEYGDPQASIPSRLPTWR